MDVNFVSVPINDTKNLYCLKFQILNWDANFGLITFSSAIFTSINLSDFISPNEFDGDLITWFQLWDSNNGNSFVLNGETIDASNGYWLEASLLKNVSLVSDTQVSSQTIYIQSYDGNEISQWDSFSFITEIS